MSTYTRGYQAGWLSYLEECRAANGASKQLLNQAQELAARASQALPPHQQSDYSG